MDSEKIGSGPVSRPRALRSWLTLIVALGAAAVLLHVYAEAELPVVSGLAPRLPAGVDGWRGDDVLFCQSEACLGSFRLGDLAQTNTCPQCGGRLAGTSPAERNLLPADTELAKKIYAGPRGEIIQATIVLSGREQKSIHRPQQCLPAQGYVIEDSRGVTVPLQGRAHLAVSRLTLRRSGRAGASRPLMIYDYWFVGQDRETPDHFQRLAWMAWDNIFHGVRQRWAYIAVSTETPAADQARAEQRLADFIRELYPLLVR
jgi:EpsI family protein